MAPVIRFRRTHIAILVTLAAPLPGCRARRADVGARVRDDGGASTDANFVKFEDLVEGLSLGKGWNSEKGSIVSQVCVEPIPGAAPADPKPVVTPAPGTGGNLRLTDADADPMYAENSFEKYVKLVDDVDQVGALATAAEGSPDGAGLRLADTPAAATVAPAIGQGDAEREAAKCNEEETKSWIANLPAQVAGSGREIKFDSMLVQSAKQLSTAMGLSGSINAKLIKGIGLEGNASMKANMNFDSESVQLFIDEKVRVDNESFKGGVRLKNNFQGKSAADLKPECGDKYVSSISYGARYVTQFTMSLKSAQSSFEGTAGGKLTGIRLGPAKLGAEGKIDAKFFSKSTDLSVAQSMFAAFGGNAPLVMPQSPACQLRFALALPRATTKENARMMAFATATNPVSGGVLGNVGVEAELVAGDYLTLIEKVAKFSGQIYGIFTNLVQYEILSAAEADKVKRDYPGVLDDLVGEEAAIAGNPGEVWAKEPKKLGGLFSRVLEQAVKDVQTIEHGTTASDVKEKIAGARANLKPLQDEFNALLKRAQMSSRLPRRFRGTVLAYREGNVAKKKTWKLADAACDSLNTDPDMKDVNAFLKASLDGAWRLPMKTEIERMRYGVPGFLNKGSVSDQVAVNAYEQPSGAASPTAYQVLTATADRFDLIEDPNASTSEAYTVCVFGIR